MANQENNIEESKKEDNKDPSAIKDNKSKIDKNTKAKLIVMIICTCILSSSILIGSYNISNYLDEIRYNIFMTCGERNVYNPLDPSTFREYMDKLIKTLQEKN